MQFTDPKHRQHPVKKKSHYKIQNILDHGNINICLAEDPSSAHSSVKHAASSPYAPNHAISATQFTFISTARNASLPETTPVFAEIDLKKLEAAMEKGPLAEYPPQKEAIQNALRIQDLPLYSIIQRLSIFEQYFNPYYIVNEQKQRDSN